MSVFAADMRRAFCSVRFFLAAGSLCACLVLTEYVPLRAVFSGEMVITGQFWYGAALCLEAAQEQVFPAVLPIAAALPFTAAAAEDLETRFGRFWLPRSGRALYVRSRIIAAALSGGAAVCLGELLAACVLTALTLPAAAGPAPEGAELTGLFLAVQWLGKLLLSFLSGALFALSGLLTAAVTGSRFMAWTMPFVSYYLLVILTQRYFPFLYTLDPEEWLSPGPAWQAGQTGAVIVMSEFILILALIAGAVLRRRIADV